MNEFEIRADYDDHSIIVYQAYSKEIGLPAIQHQRFVPPFSLGRMTWIKPSFLWMMERSNWGLKAGQEMVFQLSPISTTNKGEELLCETASRLVLCFLLFS